MKTILLSSAVLILFSISLIIFQVSCQKTAVAQTTTQTPDRILLKKQTQLQVGSTLDSLGNTIPIYRYGNDFYLVKYDGTNLSKINITMPAGEYPNGNGVLSPDGQKIIFDAFSLSNQSSVYSCYLNGTGLLKLAGANYFVQGAY